VRIEDTIEIARPPEAVFAYLTDPEKLHEWQTSTVAVRREAGGPLAQGERFKEVPTFEPTGDGTRLHFAGEAGVGGAKRLLKRRLEM